MLTRREILRAIAASAAAMAARPAVAGEAPRVVSPFVEKGAGAGLGLWSQHAVPDARLDLPGRAHAVALHPDARSCVAVARRPGRFGVAVDLDRFEKSVEFEARPDRHFFGHGAFVDEGRLFVTTENDFEAGRGVVGVRDARQGFRAVGEWPTGGVGPHDLVVSRDGRAILVANGGIDTMPATGRAMLNEDGLASSIARIDIASGRQEASITLGAAHASLSIRHLAVLADGGVAFGCQETLRGGETRPLVGIATTAGAIRWMEPPPGGWARFAGYIGEVATEETGRAVAATAPLASLCGVWDFTGRFVTAVPLADCCGVGGQGEGFVVTSSRGEMRHVGVEAGGSGRSETMLTARVGFDNHLAVL